VADLAAEKSVSRSLPHWWYVMLNSSYTDECRLLVVSSGVDAPFMADCEEVTHRFRVDVVAIR
jgi:hypothetical protein